MKYKHKIRKPKKAKKVTLQRIREIVQEELKALKIPESSPENLLLDSGKKGETPSAQVSQSQPLQGGTENRAASVSRTSVPPPPRFSIQNTERK